MEKKRTIRLLVADDDFSNSRKRLVSFSIEEGKIDDLIDRLVTPEEIEQLPSSILKISKDWYEAWLANHLTDQEFVALLCQGIS